MHGNSLDVLNILSRSAKLEELYFKFSNIVFQNSRVSVVHNDAINGITNINNKSKKLYLVSNNPVEAMDLEILELLLEIEKIYIEAYQSYWKLDARASCSFVKSLLSAKNHKVTMHLQKQPQQLAVSLFNL